MKLGPLRNQVENFNFLNKPEFQPIIFEDLYSEESEATEEVKKEIEGLKKTRDLLGDIILKENNTMLKQKRSQVLERASQVLGAQCSVDIIVLVHGFKGMPADMKILKGYLNSHFPHLHVLNSKAIEEVTEIDIDSLGFNLALDIKNYLQDTIGEYSMKSISFIGHSLGGLIVRAALPYMKDYREKMKTFMSLCTPHLGFISSNNPLVRIGLWYLRTFRNDESLHQIIGSDHKSPNQRFIYKLSLDPGLGWFRNVILAASPQDSYVNFHSARIELTTELEKSADIRQMTENIFKSMETCEKVIRIGFNYNTEAQEFLNSF